MKIKNPNKGRPLHYAVGRFMKMLIDEAHEMTGLSFLNLDAALGLESGQSARYARFPRKNSRGVQAGSIQNFENKIARLVGRPAHTIVLENRAFVDGDRLESGFIICRPCAGLNLRKTMADEIGLGYEDYWPTYYQLIYSFPIDGVYLIDSFAWQYKTMWDQGLVVDRMTGERYQIPEGVLLDDFIADHVRETLRETEFFQLIRARYLKRFFGIFNE